MLLVAVKALAMLYTGPGLVKSVDLVQPAEIFKLCDFGFAAHDKGAGNKLLADGSVTELRSVRALPSLGFSCCIRCTALWQTIVSFRNFPSSIVSDNEVQLGRYAPSTEPSSCSDLGSGT